MSELDSQVILTKIKYAVAGTISPEVLASGRLDVAEDFLTQELTARFSVDVLSDRIMERDYEATVSFPANPWQHLKDRFAPGWFKRRWPVRFADTSVRLHVDVDVHFPQARIPLGDSRLRALVFHESGHATAVAGPAVRAVLPTMRYGHLRVAPERTAR